MDQSSKDTLNFCMEFIESNFTVHSQISMCLVWTKQAVDILNKSPEISSAGFIVNELSAIEKYLTGSDTSSTSQDIHSKLDMIKTLLKDI